MIDCFAMFTSLLSSPRSFLSTRVQKINIFSRRLGLTLCQGQINDWVRDYAIYRDAFCIKNDDNNIIDDDYDNDNALDDDYDNRSKYIFMHDKFINMPSILFSDYSEPIWRLLCRACIAHIQICRGGTKHISNIIENNVKNI